MRLDLIFTLRKMYTSISTWYYSPKSTAEAETASLKISNYGTSLDDREDHAGLHESNYNLRNEQEHPHFSLKKSQWKLKQHH